MFIRRIEGGDVFAAERVEPEELESLVEGKDYLPESELIPDDFFLAIDQDMEGDNFHSMMGLPKEVFEAIKPFIRPGTETEAALAVANISWMNYG